MADSERPSILISTPCYGGNLSQNWVMSLLKLFATIGDEATIDLQFVGYDSLISRARSTLVANFLDSTRSHLLFIDADIGFEPEQVKRLIRADKEFAAAFYPVKFYDWGQMVGRVGDGETLNQAALHYVGTLCDGDEARRDGEFGLARYAGTGFQLIKRSVFERMATAYPELKYNRIHVPNCAPSDNRFAFFDCMIEHETGDYLSEDYAFCKRWRDIGGEIWLDLNSSLTHTGAHDFIGDTSRRFRG